MTPAIQAALLAVYLIIGLLGAWLLLRGRYSVQRNDNAKYTMTPNPDCHDATYVTAHRLAPQHKNRISPLVVLLLLAILLAVTNPSEADFGDYLHRSQATSQSSNPLVLGMARLVTSGLALSAERRDFALFSVYRVRLDRNTEYWWIGVFKQFIPWPESEPKPGL